MAFEPPPTQAMIAVGSRPFGLQDLLAGFLADDAMEVAHHRRVRMRSQHAAQQVVRGADVGDPVAHGFVDGVLQRARARLHAAHLGAQQPHAEDVELLPPHVFGAHVHHAFHAKQRADGRGGDAVLTGAGFGDDAMLAHAPGQQRLPNAVVDLVRAGVQQVFALQVDLRAAQFPGEPLGQEQRRGTAGKVGSAGDGIRRETICPCAPAIGGFEFLQRRHQRLGNVASAIGAEAARNRARGLWPA